MVSDRSLKLFYRAAENLPAYKRFLSKTGTNPKNINTVTDFQTLPLTSKKTYLTSYKLDDLVWPSDQRDTLLFCSTSGSTGEPYYFPRNEKLSWQYSFLVEDFLSSSSYGKGKTLVMIGFGMGVWIGGVITLRAFEIAGERMTDPIAILPTGYNKPEIFKALRKLAPQYDQTIIVGYPPFIKEVVDEAPGEGLRLEDLNIRFLFAAEAFTETFRNYVCKKAGIKNPLLDTLNIYGTADIGAMAYETPLSILIRRLAIENPAMYRDIFGQIEKTPTLAQYNPDFIEFEAVDNEIILTADGALPLIRYAVGDHGGVLQYEDIKDKMLKRGVNLDAEVQKAGIQRAINRQLPFVYVYERVDLSVTLHGINIFPEFVKEALLKPGLSRYFTERFTMSTKSDINHNQFLQVNIELQKTLEPNKRLETLATAAVKESLLKRSSEFAEVARNRATEDLLQVVLWPNGHTRYFKPGTKQKWVEKA